MFHYSAHILLARSPILAAKLMQCYSYLTFMNMFVLYQAAAGLHANAAAFNSYTGQLAVSMQENAAANGQWPSPPGTARCD